ncbi:RNA polymerase sigma factor [Geodermatophilus maliterrae]|uniref:RNA polymerase sigma factor n=1 Tax=Geodermatophilus maliterrae TaxID=3162531 RepID=A0ABV3X9A3_9ACTN
MTGTGGRACGTPQLEDLLRALTPQVLAALLRRGGSFDTCEDAVQEALLAAASQWPAEGVPRDPAGWLVTVATRRWTDAWRQDVARRRREESVAAREPDEPVVARAADDTLTLLLLCCHPALTADAQVALTLRAVGGLTTAEIAGALLVPPATVGQRISRAKQRIRAGGARFELPSPDARAERVAAVRDVLYLVFTEGHTASSGAVLHRVDLSSEAIRLTRQLHEALPGDGDTAGLLALMLLTDARRPARTRPDGSLVPLAEQDRRLWDRAAIAEGVALVSAALATTPVGAFQLQAAIAAVHDEAARVEDTDWLQVLGLYELLRTIDPGPMVALNRVVAVAMVRGPEAGLAELDALVAGSSLAGHHRTAAVRAHLLERAGRPGAACSEYERAASRTLNLPERRYLERCAQRLRTGGSE